MTDISLEGLERLIEKGRELKKFLQENPEILEYMRLAESGKLHSFSAII